MFLSLVFVAVAVSIISSQTTTKLAELNTLKTRSTLLEKSLKQEQAIYARRQQEVPKLLRDVGSSETACYKRLQAIDEFMKPANETHCPVNPKLIRSCSDWGRAGYTTNGVYTIDPDGPGGVMPFSVECMFVSPFNANDKRWFTNVHHDSERRAEVGKCKGPQCFTKTINYSVSMAQMNALILASRWCEQYVRYDCYNSRLLKGGHGAWYSRDGVKQINWGHWKTDVNKCSCGLSTKWQCVNNSTTCNCDAGLQSWNADHGWIRSKAVPITKLALGDTDGPDKGAYYTLGPLSCLGK